MPERLFAQRYRLIGLLGRTGMSEVWSADDIELERRIALKLLAPDADRARFEREARAAAALAHPNLTQLYDYGEADGRPYMCSSTCPVARSRTSSRAGRRSTTTRRTALRPGSQRVSHTRTTADSCIATSSRPTSSSTPRGTPRSRTSALRDSTAAAR